MKDKPLVLLHGSKILQIEHPTLKSSFVLIASFCAENATLSFLQNFSLHSSLVFSFKTILQRCHQTHLVCAVAECSQSQLLLPAVVDAASRCAAADAVRCILHAVEASTCRHCHCHWRSIDAHHLELRLRCAAPASAVGSGAMPERTPLVGGGAMRRAGVACHDRCALVAQQRQRIARCDSSVRSIMRGGCHGVGNRHRLEQLIVTDATIVDPCRECVPLWLAASRRTDRHRHVCCIVDADFAAAMRT
jgi:hypothetical protein